MSDMPKAIWRIQSAEMTVGLVEAEDVSEAIDVATNSLEEKRRQEFRRSIFQIDRVGYRIGEWEKMMERIGGKRV
jgi:hypothetical protein